MSDQEQSPEIPDERSHCSRLPGMVRYLSSSEATMKNLMDSGVSTVGDLLQFKLVFHFPTQVEDILLIYEVAQRSFEILKSFLRFSF